jgi:prepilin-type N-terminal cleavage/methylation domain-containing protein
MDVFTSINTIKPAYQYILYFNTYLRMYSYMQSWHHDQGMTLIETIVSLAIFSIGMLGVSGLTLVTIRGNAISQQLTAATLLAQDKLEAIYGTPYTKVSNEKEVIKTDKRRRYIRTVDVREDSPALDMKSVSITVRWENSDTHAQQVQIQTIVLKH